MIKNKCYMTISNFLNKPTIIETSTILADAVKVKYTELPQVEEFTEDTQVLENEPDELPTENTRKIFDPGGLTVTIERHAGKNQFKIIRVCKRHIFLPRGNLTYKNLLNYE